MLRKFGLVALATVSAAAAAHAADVAPVVVPPPVVIVPVAAPAGLVTAGYVGAWGGYRFRTSNEGDDDPSAHLAYGANAAISIPFAGSLSIQLETRYEHYRDTDDYSPLGALVAGGHFSFRNPDRFLVGAFAAAARPMLAELNVDTADATTGWGYIVGGEAQVYVGRATLYAQAGFGNIATDFDGGPEGFVRGWFAGIEARYFITDNFMVAANYGFGYTPCFIDGDCAPTQDAGIIHNAGASATLRIGNSPVAITAGYEFGRYYATEDDDGGYEHTFRIGLTIPFGAGTLFDNDRRGATLSLPMLPARAAAWAELLD